MEEKMSQNRKKVFENSDINEVMYQDVKHNLSIVVSPDFSKYPKAYFKIYNNVSYIDATEECCLNIYTGKYIRTLNEKDTLHLSYDEIDAIIVALHSIDENGKKLFHKIVDCWNKLRWSDDTDRYIIPQRTIPSYRNVNYKEQKKTKIKVIRDTNNEYNNHNRYVITDFYTGEILDDCQGQGYKSYNEAFKCWRTKYKKRNKGREQLEALRNKMKQWLSENTPTMWDDIKLSFFMPYYYEPSDVECLEEIMKEHNIKFPKKFSVEKLLQYCEKYKYWEKWEKINVQ